MTRHASTDSALHKRFYLFLFSLRDSCLISDFSITNLGPELFQRFQRPHGNETDSDSDSDFDSAQEFGDALQSAALGLFGLTPVSSPAPKQDR